VNLATGKMFQEIAIECFQVTGGQFCQNLLLSYKQCLSCFRAFKLNLNFCGLLSLMMVKKTLL